MMRSGAISVRSGMFPEMNTTEPYSPTPRAKASAKPVASAGQSFYGFNGIAWSDLTSWQANTSACIKGFAAPCSLPGAPSITGIEDIAPCALTGIRVTFTPGFLASTTVCFLSPIRLVALTTRPW